MGKWKKVWGSQDGLHCTIKSSVDSVTYRSGPSWFLLYTTSKSEQQATTPSRKYQPPSIHSKVLATNQQWLHYKYINDTSPWIGGVWKWECSSKREFTNVSTSFLASRYRWTSRELATTPTKYTRKKTIPALRLKNLIPEKEPLAGI